MQRITNAWNWNTNWKNHGNTSSRKYLPDLVCMSVVQGSLQLKADCLKVILGPSDAIWRHRSESSLTQVMAWCLTAPSSYLNQCWFISSMVQWHSSEGNFTRDMELWKSSCDDIHWQQDKCYIYSWQFWPCLMAVEIMILPPIFVKLIWI